MIEENEVITAAKIAKIAISKQEAEKFAEEFEAILDCFQVLKKIDTSAEEISIIPIKLQPKIRKDEVRKDSSKDELTNSCEFESGYFVGPKTA